MNQTSTNPRKKYDGDSRKLVVAIDVGTTFTAASFCIAQPDEIPQFVEILQWPKQTTADAKVPSIVMYDPLGRPRAFGAASDDDATLLDTEDEWTKCEWFKLHLRPSHLPIIEGLDLPPIPSGLKADDVFAHFLGYVKRHVQDYIDTRYAEGAQIWSSLSPNMDVVLTTPNGWELAQQQRMRAAAETAGLASGEGSGKRVRFVTEAEAAVLYAIDSGNVSEWMKPSSQLVLCDCGGGTIDITSYKILGTEPLCLEETTAAKCYLAGAVFVTNAFKAYLQEHLAGTEWSDETVIERAAEHFDKNAKRKFETITQVSLVDLGSFKSDPKLKIVRGKLKIAGDVMAGFFSKSLKHIQDGLLAIQEESEGQANNVVMVGGLASSPYIYQQIKTWVAEQGMSVARPDGPTTKAVANGALAWYFDGSVAARISRYHYGIQVRQKFSPNNLEHAGRVPYLGLNGQFYIRSAWGLLLAQGARLEDGEELMKTFSQDYDVGDEIATSSAVIYAYRGKSPPAFVESKDGTLNAGFEVVCDIEADLSSQLAMASARVGTAGRSYKKLPHDICIAFGSTEMSVEAVRCIDTAPNPYLP